MSDSDNVTTKSNKNQG